MKQNIKEIEILIEDIRTGVKNTPKHGHEFERRIGQDILQNICGFTIYNYSEYQKVHTELLPVKYAVSQLPYTTPYSKSKKRADWTLFIKDAVGFPIRLECKWQQISGTASDKIGKSINVLQDGMPKSSAIIISEMIDKAKLSEDDKNRYHKMCEINKVYYKDGSVIKPSTVKLMNLQGFVNWCLVNLNNYNKSESVVL